MADLNTALATPTGLLGHDATPNPGKLTAAQGAALLLPTQTGQSGKFLTTNGTVPSWATGGGGSSDSEGITYLAPITGSVSRNVEARLAEMVSVKDFGALGDNSTDDTVAIQAAVDTEQTVFFPPGMYKITAPIQFTNVLKLVGASSHFIGSTASMSGITQNVFGSSPAPMFYRRGGYIDNANAFIGSTTNWVGTTGVIELRRMAFFANSTYACILQTGATTRAVIDDCHFDSNYRGVFINSGFGYNITRSKFNGHCAGSGRLLVDSLQRIMLSVPGHGIVSGCDFQGCDTAMLAVGVENTIQALRVEVSAYGLRLGGPSFAHDQLGADIPFQNSTCDGISMESVWRGVTAHYVSDSSRITNINFAGLGGGAWTDAPWSAGQSDYGLKIETNFLHPASIENVSGSGGFLNAALVTEGRYYAPSRFSLTNNVSGRPIVSGLSQVISSRVNIPVAKISIIDGLFNTAKNNALAEDHRVLTYFHSQHLRGLKGLDICNVNVLPNNVGGIEAIGSTLSTLAVSFLAQRTGADAAFATVPTASGSGNTLPAGTYYYGATLIGPRGETGFDKSAVGASYKTVTVTSGQKVDMGFYGLGGAGAKLRWRIYRGTVLGAFTGYFEQAGTVTSFSDIGQAFDGVDYPPSDIGVVPSQAEGDANYGVVVTPSWLTTHRVTSKTTSGFTVDFGTPTPDANQTFQWLLFRP